MEGPNEMKSLFFEKWTNFLNLYTEYMPAENAQRLRETDFDTLYSNFHAYVLPFQSQIRAHDIEFFITMADNFLGGELDIAKIWRDGLDDMLRDKFWKYAVWFLDWFQEFS